MKCPACASDMVKARATNFGDEYDFCRTCKKELSEMTPGKPRLRHADRDGFVDEEEDIYAKVGRTVLGPYPLPTSNRLLAKSPAIGAPYNAPMPTAQMLPNRNSIGFPTGLLKASTTKLYGTKPNVIDEIASLVKEHLAQTGHHADQILIGSQVAAALKPYLLGGPGLQIASIAGVPVLFNAASLPAEMTAITY